MKFWHNKGLLNDGFYHYHHFPIGYFEEKCQLLVLAQKRLHLLPQRQMPFSQNTQTLHIAPWLEWKDANRGKFPQTLLRQDRRMGLVPPLDPLLSNNQRGVAHSPAVLSLPEYNSSWHFHFVTWGILFFLVPGIICGSIYKRKALVISPIWVPEAAMPEKQFGKVSRGQSPKWL